MDTDSVALDLAQLYLRAANGDMNRALFNAALDVKRDARFADRTPAMVDRASALYYLTMQNVSGKPLG